MLHWRCILSDAYLVLRDCHEGEAPEVQHTLQDLSFDGAGLFAEQTDSRLHSLKDSRATLKSLGVHTLTTQRKHFKPQPVQHPCPPCPREDFSRKHGRNGGHKLSQPPSNQGQPCASSGSKQAF